MQIIDDQQRCIHEVKSITCETKDRLEQYEAQAHHALCSLSVFVNILINVVHVYYSMKGRLQRSSLPFVIIYVPVIKIALAIARLDFRHQDILLCVMR